VAVVAMATMLIWIICLGCSGAFRPPCSKT
jgi:hypothetical protein